MSAIHIDSLTAGYPGAMVLRDLSLRVDDGSLCAVLGESGSGKTTLLRVLAGFLRPAAGDVRIGDRVVAGSDWIPPERRNVGIVPQEGALFPHLTVIGNVAFGLPRGERERARDLLDMVGLAAYADSHPHQLSGGQQQRVALARALAPGPGVVLLDEPFSALDVALRAELRAEVTAILRALGATAVIVTHDHAEALTMADTVAVLDAGRVVQSGSPDQLYDAPESLHVARMLGEMGTLPVIAHRAGGVECALGWVAVPGPVPQGAVVGIRPEQLVTDAEGIPVTVTSVDYRGYEALVRVSLDGHDLAVRVHGSPPRTGEQLRLALRGSARCFAT